MPDYLKHIVSRDDPVTIANQIFQKIEYLRLERAQHPPAAQLPALGVKKTILEPVLQRLAPAGGKSFRLNYSENYDSFSTES
jgi:hypothetical protein